MTRRATLVLAAVVPLAALAGAAPAAAPAPRVSALVVGPDAVLWGPRALTARPAAVRIDGRRCRARAGSALAVLAAARRRGAPPFHVRGDGACGAPYVDRVGRFGARGASGWAYKVGRRTPGVGAGAGNVRRGARVLWFWCAYRNGGCQRSLELEVGDARVPPGDPLVVGVRGYDDAGRGRPIGGARVALGPRAAVTDRAGRAVLFAPGRRGRYALTASRRGLVPAFPARVEVR